MKMINNPEEIYISDEEKEKFITIIKELLFDETEYPENEVIYKNGKC